MKYIIKSLTRWVSFAAFLQFSLAGHGQIVHIAHCMADCPSGAPPNHETVVHQLYVASVNLETGLPGWVAYRVLRDSIGVASLLPRVWQQDQLLPENMGMDQRDSRGSRVTQVDPSAQSYRTYRINEYVFESKDRGRLTPMSSFAG